VGDATSESRTTRAGSKRAAVRRRAVGTRDRIVAHLAAIAEIADSTGMASTKLAEAVGYPGSSVAFAQLLSGMERDGLITREVRGKRTYRITLSGGATVTRPTAPGRSTAGAPARAAEAPARAGGRAVADVPRNGRGTAPAGGAAAADGEPAAASATFPAEFDYDELARRLLVQVVRRLTATPAGLEQTVAGLERELATAWTRHGTLTAENMQLREQLRETQRDLDLARDSNRKLTVADELNHAEIVLLERLLSADRDSEGQQSGATA
jgi:hypothetical protein